MLIHHDSTRSYEAAASDAAKNARDKLEALIAKGRDRAAKVYEQVHTQVPRDRIAPARALEVSVDEAEHPGELVVQVGRDAAPETLHPHARNQLAERAGIPRAYVEGLLEKGDWGKRLLAHNFGEILQRDTSKALVRSVGPQVRGVLSDRYRRLDSRPVFDAFCESASELGAVPVEGYALETKVAIKALVANVFEPVPHEVLAFGCCLSNSDFGNGALSVSLFILRLACTNYAIAETPLRQVHLGKRLEENITFSQKTYELDTAATVSAVGDIVRAQLEPGKLASVCEAVKAAHEEKVSPYQISAFLAKHATKAEAKEITDVFSSADVVNVPAGQSRWRLSNACSWIAGKTTNEERRLELMKVAGDALKLDAATA